MNNIVEQDHRGVKRITKPMMGFHSFWSAQRTLAGIELVRMICKGQMVAGGYISSAQQFYALAA
ncbi:MAG: DDE-type integrase/transposase/recombinase [Gammaproteobacteria bacterium]|nr:DDE-type integrase/transposase/recombinase [Gammaproteobacteria bacterium]